MIDIKKDVVFRYLFTKDAHDNREALKGLIEAFTQETVETLTVKTPELLYGTEYTKSVKLDVLASFNDNNIDIEMQVIKRKQELKPRMIYYAGHMIPTQLDKGEKYTNVHSCYVLFFLDYIEFNDDSLIHTYVLREKETHDVFDTEREYITLITVELSKAKYSTKMTSAQSYAYVIKNFEDEMKNDKIKEIEKREKGVAYMVKSASQVSETEREWLKKYDELRCQLDENQRVSNARDEGIEIGRNEGIEIGRKSGLNDTILKLSKRFSCNEIASFLNLDVQYIESVLNQPK